MDFRGGGGVNSPFYFGVRGGSGGREPRVCLGELSQPACPSTVPGTCFVISFSPASDSDSSTSRRPLARGLDGVIRVHGGGRGLGARAHRRCDGHHVEDAVDGMLRDIHNGQHGLSRL